MSTLREAAAPGLGLQVWTVESWPEQRGQLPCRWTPVWDA